MSWGRRARQVAGEDRRAIGQRVTAPDQRADDQRDGHRLLQPGGGQPLGDPGDLGLHRVAEDPRLEHPDAETCCCSDGERTEPPQQRSGQCRHDQQRRCDRIQPRDGLDQDHREPGEHRGDGPVGRAQHVGRDAQQQRPLLVARSSTGRQPEPGQVVQRGEPDGGQDDEPDQQQAVLADGGARQAHRVLGQHRPACRDAGTGHGEPQPDDLLQVEQQAQGRDDPGQDRGLAERSEHQDVHDESDRRSEQDRKRQGGGQRRAVEQVDPFGEPQDREHQVAGLTELEERVGHVHAHGRVREVDDARGPVAQYQAERERCDDRAPAEAGEQEAQVGADGDYAP